MMQLTASSRSSPNSGTGSANNSASSPAGDSIISTAASSSSNSCTNDGINYDSTGAVRPGATATTLTNCTTVRKENNYPNIFDYGASDANADASNHIILAFGGTGVVHNHRNIRDGAREVRLQISNFEITTTND